MTQVSHNAPANYYVQTRPEMLRYIPGRVRRAVDVGCAAGGFGVQIKARFGAEVWGLENNAEQARHAAQVLDRVLVGDALENLASLPDLYFDVAVCNDVLEHMVEPQQFLSALRAKMTGTGCVVASIPNLRYFPALRRIVVNADFPSEPEGIFDSTHLRFFTRKSMIRLFETAGYRIERIEGINRTRNKTFRCLNALLLGSLNDCRYMQYAIVAAPTDENADRRVVR
jgi:2-polyprenyl-3-methyl-5-hydroxy-6-metoxy-1,4-benzoquinol methylase